MSKARTASKARRRTDVGRHSGLHAFTNSLPTPQAEVSRIMLLLRTCWQRLRDGVGSRDDLDTVGAAMNVGEVRSEVIPNGTEAVAMFDAGGKALGQAQRRHETHGRYGFTGPELAEVDAALDLYEQLLAESSPNQMEAASREAVRRIGAAQRAARQ